MNQKRFFVTSNSWIPKLAEIAGKAGVFGLDIETYSDPQYSSDPTAFGLDPWRNRIRLVQIATTEHSFIVDLHHVTEIEPLKRVIQDPSIIKLIHNAEFETRTFLRHWGVYPDNVFDTQLASQLYHRAHSFDRHRLGDVAGRYAQIYLDKQEQVSNWRDELSTSQIEYAYKDAEVLLPIYAVLTEKLESDGMMKSAKIEFDAVLAFADMVLNGIRIDLDVIRQITGIVEERSFGLRKFLSEFFPSPALSLFEAELGPASLNLDSPDQLLAGLHNLGIHPKEKDKKTKLIKDSTAKGALLGARTLKNATLIDALLDYSSLQQLFSTYCEPMAGYIHPVTGKIHGRFRQLGQAQHRHTVRKPNLLNQPRPNKFGPGVADDAQQAKKIGKENFYCELSFRQAYIPDSDCVFSIADFANNQARIVADRAGVSALIEEFNLADADPYKRIASAVLGIPKPQISKVQRQDAKTWVLAFLFGAGWERYQQAVLEMARLTITKQKALNDRSMFFRGLPELEDWHQEEPRFVSQNGYVVTPYGRRIYFDMNRTENGQLKVPRNDAINYPICGTEVDGAKDALGKVARMIRTEGYDTNRVFITGYVYDEIFAQVPEKQAESFFSKQQKIMTECMQGVLRLVPAKVDGGIGANWAAK